MVEQGKGWATRVFFSDDGSTAVEVRTTLRACYAMSVIMLRVCYAMPDFVLHASDIVLLRGRYAMCASAIWRGVSCYGSAMPCPVLTLGMPLLGGA
eukprot:673473-Rhodomonas_salina.2